MKILNVGCPYRCFNKTCVDLNPLEEGVEKGDAYLYLHAHPVSYDEVQSFNLLEHLPDVGEFLRLCKWALNPSGRVRVVTDNAEWVPFYVPVYVPHSGTGTGLHSNWKYEAHFNHSPHLSIFTKMHLENLLKYAGFREIDVKRIHWGGRLMATGLV